MADDKAAQTAQSNADPKEKVRTLLGIEPVETQHEIDLGGKTIHYTARSGAMPLVDVFGETEAELFFTAYELANVDDPSTRPLTFVFNGGPGSASVWLHMGALGPKRVVMEPEGWMPSPPFRYENNVHTWLDRTDLVFIDPVGTGYSRAAKEELDKKFMSYKGDIESVGEFIRLYLTRYRRWMSPLYLAGESYGTTRAAALSGHLVDRGIAFNGIVLISTVLDFLSIRFVESNDLPFQLFVPTYAATAWYHKKLPDELQALSLEDLMNRVRAFSETELTCALTKGDQLSDVNRANVAQALADYTGLQETYVQGTNLRINIHRFCKELLRGQRRSVGRLDSRFKGMEASDATAQPEFDPSLVAITPPYTAVMNHYARTELGIETDLVYETLSFDVNQKWEWEKGMMPATGEILRSALAKNPHMKVFVGQGYYDLATPTFATEYMISHMNVDPEIRKNIVTKYYEAGHMFYLDIDSLSAFKSDIDAFIHES